MSILDAARAAKAQQHAKNQSSLSQHLAHAKKWIDRSGVTLSDVADGKVTKQELTRPEDSAKAAQQILQGDEDDDADEHEAWESRLSATDRQILHLARAFITNPHVLVLHRPLANFDGALAQRVCNTIRNFVRNRGIPSKPGHLARTVIFSTVASNERAIETADAIIVLGKPVGGASVYEADDIAFAGEARAAAVQRVVGGWQNVFANMRKGGGGRVSDEVTPQCGANGGSNGSCQQSATDAVAERRRASNAHFFPLSGGANGGGGLTPPVRLPAPTIRRVSDDEPELEAWERESMRSSQDEEGGFTRATPNRGRRISSELISEYREQVAKVNAMVSTSARRPLLAEMSISSAADPPPSERRLGGLPGFRIFGGGGPLSKRGGTKSKGSPPDLSA